VHHPAANRHNSNSQQETYYSVVYLTTVGYKHKECSQLTGHETKYAIIHEKVCKLLIMSDYINT